MTVILRGKAWLFFALTEHAVNMLDLARGQVLLRSLIMGAKEVNKALRESFKKGLAVRQSIADLKETKKLEKTQKAKKKSDSLSVASSSSSGVPDSPPVALMNVSMDPPRCLWVSS